MHVAIMKYDKNNKVEKYMDFATQAEAQAHVDRFIDKYPSAFVGEVSGGTKYWIIDGEAKTIIYDSDTEKFDQSERAKIQYQRDRKSEYPSLNDVTIALAEKAEGRSEMWDEITVKRATVRAKYPKP